MDQQKKAKRSDKGECGCREYTKAESTNALRRLWKAAEDVWKGTDNKADEEAFRSMRIVHEMAGRYELLGKRVKVFRASDETNPHVGRTGLVIGIMAENLCGETTADPLYDIRFDNPKPEKKYEHDAFWAEELEFLD